MSTEERDEKRAAAKRMQRMFFAEARLAEAAGEWKQARRCEALGRKWAAAAASV